MKSNDLQQQYKRQRPRSKKLWKANRQSRYLLQYIPDIKYVSKSWIMSIVCVFKNLGHCARLHQTWYRFPSSNSSGSKLSKCHGASKDSKTINTLKVTALQLHRNDKLGNHVKQKLDDGEVWTNLWKRIKFHGTWLLICWWRKSSSIRRKSTILTFFFTFPTLTQNVFLRIHVQIHRLVFVTQWTAWIKCTCL